MDKAQQRHDAAMRKLRERATEVTSARQPLTAERLFAELNLAYFAGVVDGGDSEQEWHQAIGGCQR